MQSRRAGRCLGLKQDWQVTRQAMERPLFFLFYLSCWRALYLVSFSKISPSAELAAHVWNSAHPKEAQPRAAVQSPSSHDHQMSLSHGICVPSLKINTTQINGVLTIVTSPDPHADVTMLESTATRSAGCSFKEALDTQVTGRNGGKVLRNG